MVAAKHVTIRDLFWLTTVAAVVVWAGIWTRECKHDRDALAAKLAQEQAKRLDAQLESVGWCRLYEMVYDRMGYQVIPAAERGSTAVAKKIGKEVWQSVRESENNND